ncbi:MAG: hypothetical protein N2V78_10610 [Methanophagales archaeon]|nr:hypothetical protein [Methanophagales archaeon]
MKYAELLSYFRKGLRNGNWHRLSHRGKGLYRAVLFYTKVKGEIVNSKLAVFEWCPQLKEWLREPDYIFWLGLSASKSIRHPRRSLSQRQS